MSFVAAIRRAFVSNLKAISMSSSEQAALQSAGIAEPTLQRYVLWRRGTMLMVVLATFLSASVSAYLTLTESDDEPDFVESMADELWEKLSGVAPTQEAEAKTDATTTEAEEEKEPSEPQTAFSLFEDVVHLLSLWILPFAALAALLLRNRFRLSYKILVTAFVFSFFVPIFFALCPWSWWGYKEAVASPGKDPMGYFHDMMDGVFEGVSYLGKLLPAVLSLVPGVLKGCLRVKTLLPESLLPGWFIVVVAPFYGLFLLVVFVAIDQVTSDPVIVSVMLLLIAAHFVYAFRAKSFTSPLLSDADYARMATSQRIVSILTVLAGLILVGTLLTTEVMGVHFVGTDPDKSLLHPIELTEYVLEFLARSLFVCALGADFFVRMNLTAWRQGKTLEGTPAAQSYDEAMQAIDHAVKA